MREAKDHFVGHHYDASHVRGPVKFLNPTVRLVPIDKEPGQHADTGAVASEAAREHQHQVYHVWRSRDNRKGRHSVAVSPDYAKDGKATAPRPTNTLAETLRGIWKMVVRYRVWDVSYDVAVIFTLGSVVWCFNGFFVWLPLAAPSTEFEGEVTVGGGITGFIGATIFEFGSVLLMLEAVNENTSDCFGWALEDALSTGVLDLHRDHSGCRHSHRDKRSFLRRKAADEVSKVRDAENRSSRNSRKWSWWPSNYELKTHYFRDIGFLACFSQMIGATIFWIAGFTGLPHINDVLSTPALNGIYWLPQTVGGTGFIISSILFMLEVQDKWYKPNLASLGWHIGFWNLIGALGFTLCGALGFGVDQPGVEYALTLSTFVGSWAFLIGSLIQWFESLNKYPISVDKRVSQLSDNQQFQGI